MAQNQLLHPGFLRHPSGIARRAMIALSRRFSALVAVGCLVVEPIHPLHRLCHTVVAHRVGAVGIAHARFCRSGEHSVGNHRAVGFHIVLARAEAVHKVVWHFVIACHLRIDVAQLWFLHKLESHRRNAVEQRECVHLNGVVLINQTLLALYYIEFHFKRHLAAEVVEKSPELVGSVLEYVHGECAPLL